MGWSEKEKYKDMAYENRKTGWVLALFMVLLAICPVLANGDGPDTPKADAIGHAGERSPAPAAHDAENAPAGTLVLSLPDGDPDIYYEVKAEPTKTAAGSLWIEGSSNLGPHGNHLCDGGSFTLYAKSSGHGSGVTWYWWRESDGATIGTGSSLSASLYSGSDTYHAVAKNAQGSHIGEASQYVYVTYTPNTSLNASRTSVCPGGSVTLTAGGAGLYIWSGESIWGNSSKTVYPSGSSTTYTVTGADGGTGRCRKSKSITIAECLAQREQNLYMLGRERHADGQWQRFELQLVRWRHFRIGIVQNGLSDRFEHHVLCDRNEFWILWRLCYQVRHGFRHAENDTERVALREQDYHLLGRERHAEC